MCVQRRSGVTGASRFVHHIYLIIKLLHRGFYVPKYVVVMFQWPRGAGYRCTGRFIRIDCNLDDADLTILVCKF